MMHLTGEVFDAVLYFFALALIPFCKNEWTKERKREH